MRARHLIVLAFGVACVSTAAVLIRLAEAPPLAIAAWRMAFASAIVLPLALYRSARRDAPAGSTGRLPWLSDHRNRRRALLAGAMLALHFALWITSLGLTSVASSVVLVTTNPLWVGLASPIVLGESISATLWAGIATAFAGGAIIASADRAAAEGALLGDALALGGAFAAAAYFLIGRQLRAHLRLLDYVAIVYTTAAAILLIAALAARVPLSGFPPQTWACFAALALVPQVLGHSSFNWALEHLSATVVSGAVLGEAVGSVLLAWWVLGEAPGRLTFVGGAIVLAGLAIAIVGESRRHEGPSPPSDNDASRPSRQESARAAVDQDL